MRPTLTLAVCLLLACGSRSDPAAPAIGAAGGPRTGPTGPLDALLARSGLRAIQIELAFFKPGQPMTYRTRTLEGPADLAAGRAVLEAARVEHNPLKWEADDRSSITLQFSDDESATIDVYYPCRYLSVGSGQSRVYYEVNEPALRQLCAPSSPP